MRDHGLEEAIRAAGGVSELARQLGISQPSVSNWDPHPGRTRRRRRIPHQRTAPCAAPRSLRPQESATSSTRSMPRARTNMRCSSSLLSRTPNAALMARLANCAATPRRSASRMSNSPKPRAAADHAKRSSASSSISSSASAAANCCLTRSYYLTGFLHERPLARLREDLCRVGIERREGNAEPEDHAAHPVRDHVRPDRRHSLSGAGRHRPDRFSRRHVRPGSAASSPISSGAGSADFYRRVGTLGRVFVEIETEAFSLAA